MSIEQKPLGNYSISRIINGGRQLSGGHGVIQEQEMIQTLIQYVKQGITTFDCADIYTGVEELYGNMLHQVYHQCGEEVYKTIKIHTKCVPDLQDIRDRKVNKQYIEAIIDRSLQRLGQEQLDLVQLHHRDYTIETYVEIAHYLKELQQSGKINQLGVTNYNTQILKEIVKSGITFVSTQNQYSLLDRRPEGQLVDFCVENNIKLLCYGTLAGGFLTEKYLGTPEIQPDQEGNYENRSLKKYKLVIDDFGGRDLYQELLGVLDSIAKKHQVTLSDVAMRYILEKPQVGGIIVGSRNANYVSSIQKPFIFSLDNDDYFLINTLLKHSKTIAGDCFDAERNDEKHASIMKKNLNTDPNCKTG